MQISATARLEFGFRIQSTHASYRELESLLGADTKLDWARTKTHPNRTKFFAIPAEIDGQGHIAVPDNVMDAFTRYGGFLMVKLVTPQPVGRYANLAMYHRLWGLDKKAPQRDNGDYVYSMPIQGLEQAGEGKRFFFVLRLNGKNGDTTNLLVAMIVERFTVTRGKGHFTIIRSEVAEVRATTELLVSTADAYRDEKDETFHPLKDIPTAEALAEYLTVLHGGSLL